jgi:hypothetical protein
LNNEGELYNVFTTEGHFYSINQTYKRIENNKKLNNIIRQTLLNLPNQTNSYNNGFKERNDVKICKLKISTKKYYNMRYNLPMKMSYFDQLFEMVGVNDNNLYTSSK